MNTIVLLLALLVVGLIGIGLALAGAVHQLHDEQRISARLRDVTRQQ